MALDSGFGWGATMIRWANEDVELGGVVIPAVQATVAEHDVANGDESVFPRGWELDFHVKDPEPHLSLARGVHRCLGAHLGQLEVAVGLERLLARFHPHAIAPADSRGRRPRS